MTETIDHETGEILATPPARAVPLPTPYQSADTGLLATALAAAQGAMEAPKRTKTGKIQGTARGSGNSYSYEYQYAPFEEVVRVLRAPLADNNLAWHQGLVTRSGEYFVRTLVRHGSGEWIASDYPVIADKSGPQGFAAATTYAKRYGLSLALGVAAEDDDDGAAAQAAAPQARAEPRQQPISTKAAVEARLNGGAAQPAPAAPAADQEAREVFARIRDEIDAANSIHALNTTGINRAELVETAGGVWSKQYEIDKQVIDAAAPGVWQRLVDRDAGRRRVLVRAELDEEIPL